MLTPEQQLAVASRAHALEIRAGAGTGKTTTLAHRLARLVQEERVPEHRLLAVTFTRDATVALSRKLGALLGKDHGVRVASFHQWAARALAPEEPRFLDAKDARAIVLRELRREARGLAAALARAGGEDAVARALGFVSYVKSAETTVGDAVLRHFPALAAHEDALRRLFDAYEERRGARLDYDDLLLAFRDRLARKTAFRAEVAAGIDHLAVDEYQDVNEAQAGIVRRLTKGKDATRVSVVGDPRQSIYGFRGSTPRHLDGFLEPYGKKGARVALTVSFRGTRALVTASNLALPDAHPLRPRPRAPAGVAPDVRPCEDAKEEARLAAGHVRALLDAGTQEGDIAVLSRTRGLAGAYVEELSDRRDAELNRVRLSTIHAAKGLEWDHVVLLGAREGGLPSDHALRAEGDARKGLIEEERRLFYVAITRARKTLLVTWPEKGDRRDFAASRFLSPWEEASRSLEVREPAEARAMGGKERPRVAQVA